MNTELFWIKTPDPTNPQKTILQAFNLFSLLIIFAFIFAGLLFAWAFEKFILQRIFGVLFVDPGVQNTVSKIGRYFIIILFFILGLLKVDLGASIFYFLGLILIGIAWALKEPVNDVIAYFTILVERSIKIGDYIELADTEKRVVGVVRKINLRTVVLRRNNSVSVVVPNSVITNNTVYNWNYVSGFFAFPDIILTVNYQADPQEVRDIIAQVLEENGNVLRRPEPIIRLEEFSVNGYTFLIRAFLTSNKVLEQWDIASSIRFALAINLNKAGIRICTPARLITIDNGQLTNDSIKIKEGA
jgi:small-conductance mechanosensitive channel